MKRLALGVMILAVPGLGAQDDRRVAKDYPKSGVYWSKTWGEAWGEAWNRNVPIFVAVHKDGSEECAEMASLFRDKRFIEYSRMWVNLIVHSGTAHEVRVEIDGKKVLRCDLYFDIACRDHAEAGGTLPASMKDYTRFPTRMFCNKDQKVLGRETGPARLSELIKAMDRIQAQIPGEKMSADVWRKQGALLAEGDAAFKRKEWQKAIKAYREVIKIGGTRKSNGENGLMKVNLEGEFLFTIAFDAQPKDGKGDYTETKRILRKIINDFTSLPIEEKARKFLRELIGHGN